MNSWIIRWVFRWLISSITKNIQIYVCLFINKNCIGKLVGLKDGLLVGGSVGYLFIFYPISKLITEKRTNYSINFDVGSEGKEVGVTYGNFSSESIVGTGVE